MGGGQVKQGASQSGGMSNRGPVNQGASQTGSQSTGEGVNHGTSQTGGGGKSNRGLVQKV